MKTVLASAALCFAPMIWAQQPTPLPADDRVLTIEINALANEQASSYVVVLSVGQISDTPDKAERLLRDRCKPFITDLQRPTIQANEVYTDFVSLKPMYQPKIEKGKVLGDVLAGFEYRQNLHIAYANPTQLPKILLAAAKYEIYDVVGVEARYNQANETFEHLRQRCFDYLKTYVKQLEELGIEAIDWERTISEKRSIFYPNDGYKTFQSEQILPTTVPFDPRTEKPVVERKSITSQYYQRLPAETFEIVVNKDMLEPTVQLVYDLRVNFIVPREQSKWEIRNEIIMPKQPAPVVYPTPSVVSDSSATGK